MATVLCGLRSAVRSPASSQLQRRTLTTLQNNPHIVRTPSVPSIESILTYTQYVFPSPSTPNAHLLSLLPTSPPTPSLAVGTTTKLPPTPDSLTENPHFLSILQSVISQHAASDPEVQSQAQVMASTAGANLGSGGVFFAPKSRSKKRGPAYGSAGATGGDSAGGASVQGGAGGAGRGGFIHVSDARNPPEYGRIAWWVLLSLFFCV